MTLLDKFSGSQWGWGPNCEQRLVPLTWKQDATSEGMSTRRSEILVVIGEGARLIADLFADFFATWRSICQLVTRIFNRFWPTLSSLMGLSLFVPLNDLYCVPRPFIYDSATPCTLFWGKSVDLTPSEGLLGKHHAIQ